MKKIVILLLPLLFQFHIAFAWSWPSCRNTSGGSPEQPSSVFLGDNATFGHDSWSTVDGNWPKWRVLIHTGSDINNGIAGSWSSTSNIEHKTATSARFTSTGSWYWGFEVDYSTDGSKWYCQNNSSWSGMWGSPTSNLTITVNALNNPATYSAALNSGNPSTQIDLSWTKDGQNHNVMILRKKSTASWTEPTQGHAYIVGDTIGAATVIYNGSGTTFTDNVNSSTSYDYKFYSENYSYYSSGVSPSTITTNSAATDYFRSKATGTWNSNASWESSNDGAFWVSATSVPGASSVSSVIQNTHTITLIVDASVKNLSIRSGGVLSLGSNTLTIAAGGSFSNNDGGTFNASSGTLNFNGGGGTLSNSTLGIFNAGTCTLKYYGAGGGSDMTISGNLAFYNVIAENGGIDFGGGTTSYSGTFTIKPGGYAVGHSASAISGSTLRYETGGSFNTSIEWNNPYNVVVSNASSLMFDANNRTVNGNLTIENGSAVTLSGTTGKDLYVKGNLINNGTFNANSRAVFFNGTADQEIKGTSATTLAYVLLNNTSGKVIINADQTATFSNDLTIDNGTSLQINPNKSLTVSGAITNNAGNTGVIIKSDATGTGSLIHNTAGISGTIERYITGSTNNNAMKYHMVSVPFDSTDANYSGIFEGAYLFYFNETDNVWKAMGSPVNTPLYENRGYLIYYILGDEITYSMTGHLNHADFPVYITSHIITHPDLTKGWNLVPNPFPSALDWDASGWTKDNIDGSIYFWPAGTNYYTGNYSIYNSSTGGTGTPVGTKYIPVGQSFFVHTNALSGCALTVPASARVHNNQAFYKKTGDEGLNLMHLTCTDSIASDDIIVHFSENATTEFDNQFDAFKLTGGYKAPQLSTVTSDSYRVSINSLPLASGQQVVPVNLNYYQPAQLTFTASGMENFEHQPTIFLEDKLENKLINLYEQQEYTFDYSTNDTARFNLIFTDFTNIEKPATSSFIAYQQEDRIRILYPEIKGEKAAVRLYDMTGKMVSSTEAVFGEIIDVKAPETQGVYIIQVVNKDKTNSRKIVIL